MNKYSPLVPTIEGVRWTRQFSPLNVALIPVLSIAVALGVFFLFAMHIHFLYKNETTIECTELSSVNRFK